MNVTTITENNLCVNDLEAAISTRDTSMLCVKITSYFGYQLLQKSTTLN
jgi:hypothetical protein